MIDSRAAIRAQRHAHDVRPPAQAGLPVFVAEDDHSTLATEVLLERVGAAEHRLDAQRRKEVVPRSARPFSLSVRR